MNYMSGEMHRRLGDNSSALENYKKALELFPEKDPKKAPRFILWAKEQISLVEPPKK